MTSEAFRKCYEGDGWMIRQELLHQFVELRHVLFPPQPP